MLNFLKRLLNSQPHATTPVESKPLPDNWVTRPSLKPSVESSQFSDTIDFTDMTTVLYRLITNQHQMDDVNDISRISSRFIQQLTPAEIKQLRKNYLNNDILAVQHLNGLLKMSKDEREEWLIQQIKTLYQYDYLKYYIHLWQYNHVKNDNLATKYQKLAQHGDYVNQVKYLKDIKIVNDSIDMAQNMDASMQMLFQTLTQKLLNQYDQEQWVVQLLSYDLLDNLDNFYENQLKLLPLMVATMRQINDMTTLINYLDLAMHYYDLNTYHETQDYANGFFELLNTGIGRSRQLQTQQNPFDLFKWPVVANFEFADTQAKILKQLRQLKIWQYQHDDKVNDRKKELDVH